MDHLTDAAARAIAETGSDLATAGIPLDDLSPDPAPVVDGD